MKWLFFVAIAAVIGGVSYYVWDYNRGLEVAAAGNNDAVCQVTIQMDEELWGIYTGGDFAGAVVGNITSTQEGNVLTTEGSVSSEQPKLVNEIRQILNELDLVSGSVCDVSIGKFPAMTPGRIKVDLSYYRPTARSSQEGQN